MKKKRKEIKERNNKGFRFQLIQKEKNKKYID
jgi:hypothetical protein